MQNNIIERFNKKYTNESATSDKNNEPNEINELNEIYEKNDEEIGKWLYFTPGLSPIAIGRYLECTQNNSAKFKVYLQCFNFSNMQIDEALKLLSLRGMLIGNSYTADTTISMFAHHWCECNQTSTLTEMEVHSISIFILMLHTSIHHPNAEKMTKLDFFRLIRKNEQLDNIDQSYTDSIYDRVAKESWHEIKSMTEIKRISLFNRLINSIIRFFY